ncbi:MAG: YabP/YqfC family sporulation protein [Bacilli bacterium]
MQLINKVRSYLLEDEFKMIVLENRINIVNYTKIGHFDNSKVEIYHNDGKLLILGKNLVVSKLIKDEILISGLINNIEFR